MLLQNKTAVITGVSNGLGYEMAKVFQEEGCHVIGVDILKHHTDLDDSEYYRLDVSNYKACEKAVETIYGKHPKINILASDLSSYITGSVIDVNGGMRL